MIRPANDDTRGQIQDLQYQMSGKALLTYLTAERGMLLDALVRSVDLPTVHRLQGAVMALDDIVKLVDTRTP